MKSSRFLFATFLVGSALALAGCTQNNNANTNATDDATTGGDVNTNVSANVNDGQGMMKADQTVVVNLDEQNKSGQKGTVTLTAMGDKTKVTIDMTSGAQDVPQPAHIHLSSCATMGDVKYALTSVLNGKSETVVNASLDTILASLPLSINVHKSASESSSYVVCGDIKQPATDDKGMMEDNKADGGSDMMEDKTTGPDVKLKVNVNANAGTDSSGY